MKATFIQTPEQLDAQYHRLLPIFERVQPVDEYSTKQLFQLAKEGKAVIGYVEEDGKVLVAAAIEFIHYPNMTAMNIIALAGEQFDGAYKEFMGPMVKFGKLAGATHIEALCHDSMARLLQRYGFSKSNTQMRVKL